MNSDTVPACHCKSGPGEFGPGRLNLLVSHIGEFCSRDHIPWTIWSVVSEFGRVTFPWLVETMYVFIAEGDG